MNTGDTYHLASVADERRPVCGATLTKWVSPSPLPESARSKVNCPDCLGIINQQPAGSADPARIIPLDEREQSFRDWTIAVVTGDTVLGYDEWCRRELGVGASTPRHKPPYMNDKDDGIFEFYDVDYYAAVPLSNTASMEVVPQDTGNVEITLGDSLFTLSHLDRADLIRALLHDFHYSPERGGPNDDH